MIAAMSAGFSAVPQVDQVNPDEGRGAAIQGILSILTRKIFQEKKQSMTVSASSFPGSTAD